MIMLCYIIIILLSFILIILLYLNSNNRKLIKSLKTDINIPARVLNILTDIYNNDNRESGYDSTQLYNLIKVLPGFDTKVSFAAPVPDLTGKEMIKERENKIGVKKRGLAGAAKPNDIEKYVYFTLSELFSVFKKGIRITNFSQLGFRIYFIKYDCTKQEVKTLLADPKLIKDYHDRDSVFIALTEKNGQDVVQSGGENVDVNVGQLCPPGCDPNWNSAY